MKYCTQCGHKVLETQRFCAECGTQIPRAEQDASVDNDSANSKDTSVNAWGTGLVSLSNSSISVWKDFTFAYAIHTHNNDKFTKLLNDSDDVNVTDRNGANAAHYAVTGDNPEALKLFAQAGGNITLTAETSLRGHFTPLMAAVEMENTAIVNILLDLGADPNFRNTRDMSALTIASYRKNIALTNLLIERGADASLEDLAWSGQFKSYSDKIIHNSPQFAITLFRTFLTIKGFPKLERVLFKKVEVVPAEDFLSSYAGIFKAAVYLGYTRPDQAISLIQCVYERTVPEQLKIGLTGKSHSFALFIKTLCPDSQISDNAPEPPWLEFAINHFLLDPKFLPGIQKNKNIPWQLLLDDNSDVSKEIELCFIAMLAWGVLHPNKVYYAVASEDPTTSVNESIKDAYSHAGAILKAFLEDYRIEQLELDPIFNRACSDESHSQCVSFGEIEHLSIQNRNT